MAEFAVNKIYLVFLFIANYGIKLRMGANIRKKRESGERNGVCRKNKEGIRGSRNTIRKSTRGDETTSR